MSLSIQKGILDIPDEILEDNLLTLLSFEDLINLMTIRNSRLIRCCGVVINQQANRPPAMVGILYEM